MKLKYRHLHDHCDMQSLIRREAKLFQDGPSADDPYTKEFFEVLGLGTLYRAVPLSRKFASLDCRYPKDIKAVIRPALLRYLQKASEERMQMHMTPTDCPRQHKRCIMCGLCCKFQRATVVLKKGWHKNKQCAECMLDRDDPPFYCSVQCQEIHWPTHRIVCGRRHGTVVD